MTNWFQYPISHGYIPNHLASDWDSPHFADDLAMPMDTPITAFKSGVVKQADYAVWGGKQGGGEVWIQPDDGSTEYYFYHLDNFNVKAGQHVNAGDRVGLSGGQNTGGQHPTDQAWSTGPHLHIGYFTNFAPTQIGTRPAGPDISGELALLRVGGIPPSTASTSTDSSQPINYTTSGIKIGVFILALVVVMGGAYFLFQGQVKQALGRVVHDA